MSLELALQEATAAMKELVALLRNQSPAENNAPIAASDAEDPPKTKRGKKEVLQAAPVGEFVEEATAPSPEPTATDAPATEAAAAPTEPLTYADVKSRTLDLIEVRGRDAAVKVLAGFGVQRADQIEEARWPAYLAAVELEKEIPL
jgi:hypothetical protein